MNRTTRSAAALVGAVAATTMAFAPAAQSTTLAPSHTTVTSTDYTPASGQTFRLHGAVWSHDQRVPAVVHVKTYRNGHWVQLTGASMSTNRDNQYNIRVVLQMKGERQLRVVGDPKPAGIATSHKTITVTVH